MHFKIKKIQIVNKLCFFLEQKYLFLTRFIDVCAFISLCENCGIQIDVNFTYTHFTYMYYIYSI